MRNCRVVMILSVLFSVVGMTFLGSVVSAVEGGRVIHVSTQGSDSGNGSADAPFATIERALQEAGDGDTVRLSSGTYREGGLTISSRVRLEAGADQEVVISGAEQVQDWDQKGSVWVSHEQLVRFCQNCTKNPDPDYDGVKGYPEQVYLDGEPLRQVASRDEVTEGTFYVDPVNGDDGGDGSLEHPWKSIQYVVEHYVHSRSWASLPPNEETSLEDVNPNGPVEAGDRILLREGYHGALEIVGRYNEAFVTIGVMEGETALLQRLLVRAGSYWHFQDLTLSPESDPPEERGTLITLESHNWQGRAHHLYVHGCHAQTVLQTDSWGVEEWNTLPYNGAFITADHVRFEGNTLRNVDFGITVRATFVDIIENTVENFAGDGLRGLGDDLLFEGNLVKNCYDVNENHDDGFQSWAIDGDPPQRVVLRGNTFINYEDENQPFKGQLQGIGCFDGFYEDWIVENNLVVVDHWHGITFMGAHNVIIRNNTVVNRDPTHDSSPWIRIDNHKDGTPSTGCVIANNIAVKAIHPSEGTLQMGNLLVGDDDLTGWFLDPTVFDYHLREDTPPINAGEPDYASPRDKDGKRRDTLPDVGCYEF